MTLRDIRGGVGALLLFFAAICVERVSGGNHKPLTYAVWFSLTGAALVVFVVTTVLIARRPADLPVETSTFRGGELGGDSKLQVRSTADHLTDGTTIGDRVELDAHHNPMQTNR